MFSNLAFVCRVDMKCHICWKDAYTLIVGWAETAWVCHVEKRSKITPMDASPYVVHPGKYINFINNGPSLLQVIYLSPALRYICTYYNYQL